MKIIRSVLPPLILLALSFIYFADIFISDEIFSFRDLSRYYYPLRLFAVNLIKSGDFPFWNPYIASGHPLFATLQSVVLYPLSIIYYLGDFDTGFNLFIVLHIFLGGLFFYLLMRDLRFDYASALISAVVFSFSGYLISVINLTTTLAAAIWFPLVFLFYKRFIEEERVIYLVAASVFLGFMFLGGEPTPLYATVFLLGLYTLLRGISDKKRFLRICFLYVACVMIFILLFSFQIVPLWELIRLSDRTYTEFDKATFWSFHPRNVIHFLLPFFYGPPLLRSHEEPSPLTQDWLLLSYLGVVPVILFFIAFIFGKGRDTAFFKASFIVGLIFVFGRFTPIYKFLYKYLPGFSLIRYPVKFFFINAVSFAYLCGAGFSAYWEGAKAANPRLSKFIKGLFVFGFIAAILFLLLYIFRDRILSLAGTYSEHLETVYEGSALGFYITIFTNFFNFRRMLAFFILGALFMFIGTRKRFNLAVFGTMIITLIFIDFYGGKNIEVNPSVSKGLLHAVTPNMRIVKADKGLFRVYTSYKQSKVNEVLRGDTYEEAMLNSLDTLCANRPLEHGIYSVRGYLSLPRADYAKVLMMLDSSPLPSATNILNMLNVKYIVTPEEIDDPTCRLINKGVSYLYENKNVLARAYLVPDYVVLKTEREIADEMRSREWRPDREVILEEEPRLAYSVERIADRKEKEGVDILKYHPNEVVIETLVKKEPKFLVLADSCYPGWEVKVDGKKSRLYKANFILRAVHLSPGRHTVRFFYNPVSFKMGALISLVTVFLLVFVGVFLKVR